MYNTNHNYSYNFNKNLNNNKPITPSYSHVHKYTPTNENIYKSYFDKSIRRAKTEYIKNDNKPLTNSINLKSEVVSKKEDKKANTINIVSHKSPIKKDNLYQTIYPCGVNFNQGRRPYMEDRYIITNNNTSTYKSSLYGVFDGHGGYQTAQYCVDNIARVLYSNSSFPSNPEKALKESFNTIDRTFCTTPAARMGI